MDEHDIAQGCKQGSRAAQRALFDARSPRLMATVMRYVGNEDDARDVLQDALVRIYTSIDRFAWRGTGSLWAWTDRVAINTAIDWLRQHHDEAVNRRTLDQVKPEDVDEPDAADVEAIDPAVVMRLVAALPPGYRTVFNLYCLDGYSHTDIARRLGISAKTSSSQLARARALLAKQIKDYLEKHQQ